MIIAYGLGKRFFDTRVSHILFSSPFVTKYKNEIGLKIVKVRSDHDGEVENKHLEKMLWAKIVNIVCYIQKKYLRPSLDLKITYLNTEGNDVATRKIKKLEDSEDALPEATEPQTRIMTFYGITFGVDISKRGYIYYERATEQILDYGCTK